MIIIRFLYCLTLFCITINIVYGSQFAHVKKTKAIIYADQNLETPIGYIVKGKTIKVGETPRKYGTILPILVSGKIAWIKIEDIKFSELNSNNIHSSSTLEHAIYEPDDDDKFSENNHIVFVNNVFVPGEEWDLLSKQFGDDTGERPKYYSIYAEHRNPKKRFLMAVGLSYFHHLQESIFLTAYLLETYLGYSVLKFRYVSIDLLIGGFVTTEARFESSFSSVSTKDDVRGDLLGYKYGLQIKYFPYHKFGIINGISFSSTRLYNFNPIAISYVEDDTLSFDKFSGVNYYLGLTVQF